MKINKKSKKLLIQFAEYMISGGAWFWAGYGAFAFLDIVVGLSFWPTKIASYIIGASFNFLLQKFWVFRHKSSKKQSDTEAKRYYGLMAVNFALDQGIVGGLKAVGLTPYIGQFVASGFFTVWNWLWYSKWVFKKKNKAVKHKKQHSPVLHRHKKVRHPMHKIKKTKR